MIYSALEQNSSATNIISLTCHLQKNTAAHVLFSTFLVAIISLSLTGNAIICGIVYKKESMRSGINLLLANLAFSDFLSALTNLPITVVVYNSIDWPLGSAACTINGVLYNVLNANKIFILLVISVDRYFIIVKRKDTVTPSKGKLLILCSWIFALIISVPPVFGWGKYLFTCGSIQCLLDFQEGSNPSYTLFNNLVTVFGPSFILLITYHRILRTVRRNCFRVQNHPPVTPTAMHRKGKLFIDYSYKTRTSTTILLLCAIFFCSVFPLSVVNLCLAFNENFEFNKDAYSAVLWISYLHGAIDPIIFYTRITKFRETVHYLLPQVVYFPTILPLRTKRRVRPHVIYSIGKSGTQIIMGNGI